jgi:hypothetical protein
MEMNDSIRLLKAKHSKFLPVLQVLTKRVS